MLSEDSRLAAERHVAHQLLDLVYDASPLVRAEVAAAIARLAVGHAHMFEVRPCHMLLCCCCRSCLQCGERTLLCLAVGHAHLL